MSKASILEVEKGRGTKLAVGTIVSASHVEFTILGTGIGKNP